MKNVRTWRDLKRAFEREGYQLSNPNGGSHWEATPPDNRPDLHPVFLNKESGNQRYGRGALNNFVNSALGHSSGGRRGAGGTIVDDSTSSQVK